MIWIHWNGSGLSHLYVEAAGSWILEKCIYYGYGLVIIL
uniref:Uncharacterized protein n=1 Tax=Nelumbo nucifera TaxID=4432 RepID=A0A822Z2N5_NELNU|nr:TPA_asm: hypothetical protein HUJ06_013615 [Nelumbo nucifera]